MLEQSPFVLPEHFQNLPFMGGAPDMRVPWVVRPGSDLGYAGLLYVVGGRSLTWGGWSPELLHDANNDEMTGWPGAVITDLQGQYFYDAGEQIGVNSTNDFVHGPLHQALRQMLFAGIVGGSGAGGPFASLPLTQLPDHLSTADGRQGVAVIALGTIESARIALTTFQASLAGRAVERMGGNLMVHLRSNLTSGRLGSRLPRHFRRRLPVPCRYRRCS